LSAAQSRDFGIGKFPGSRDSGIPGLQSLVLHPVTEHAAAATPLAGWPLHTDHPLS